MFSKRVRRNDAPSFPILCALSVCALDESNTSIYIFFPTQNYMTLPTQLYVLTNSYTCAVHIASILIHRFNYMLFTSYKYLLSGFNRLFNYLFTIYQHTIYRYRMSLFLSSLHFLKSLFGAFPIFFLYL